MHYNLHSNHSDKMKKKLENSFVASIVHEMKWVELEIDRKLRAKVVAATTSIIVLHFQAVIQQQ